MVGIISILIINEHFETGLLISYFICIAGLDREKFAQISIIPRKKNRKQFLLNLKRFICI